MAEVFGVVVSALTVAEMAGKFGGSIIKLKKLWDEVQDVPNEISQLVRQLEVVRPVLAEMESEFTQQTHQVYHNSAANLSMEYCQQAVAELDALAEDLRSRIEAAKRSRRNITKLKVTFKKEQIRGYQEKIQFALQLLSLSQQTYTISVVKSRFLTFPDPAPRADSAQTRTPQQLVQPQSAPENTLARRNMYRRTRHELTAPAMPLQKASFFGGFVYRTVSDPNHPDIQVRQARVQLPRWVSETFWDFQAYRACTGWKVSLKPWTMRPKSDPIFNYIIEGSLNDVMKALKSNKASLQDIDENGWTLLHHAILYFQCDITKALIEMGLSLDIVENQNMTPLNYLGSKILHINDEVPSFRLVQFLLDTGELDGDIERFFMPEKVGLSCNFPALMWRIPGVLDMVIKRSIGLDSYYRLPLDARFQRLMWHYVAPEVLLNDIHKSGNLEPADFRPVLDFSPESSIYGFVWTYFRELIRDGIHYYYPNKMSGKVYNKFHHWRELARWVFGGLSARDLNQMKKRPPWPMRVFDGLVELQYCLYLVTFGLGPLEPRFAQKAFLIWLEDMQAAGVDLAEYGRQELEIYLTHGSLQGLRWFHKKTSVYHQHIASGWKLVGFTYGPEPEDWKFTWDLDAWEYAGDFWEQVENPPLRIPGGWVDDESW